jgi:4-amino-4-deoxy-L-arabinose transferase-like glycosyltransferase
MSSATRTSSLRNASLFVLTAIALLLGGLGARSLWGSEDRWAEIVRQMLGTGDWFHPVINGELYFYKPLLTYWWIGATAWLTGALDEFTVRLPSVMAGIIVLWATYSLGSRLWNRQVAWLALWLLLTSYGFLFWTHAAAAEMANVAFIMLAVAWFFRNPGLTTFRNYLVFWLICAVGAGMKGLTAFIVPALVLFPWLIRERRLLQHLNVAHLFAALIGIALFLSPYLGAAWLPMPASYVLPGDGLGGLELIVHENMVRFFQPFDHRDPVYSYLYHVPRLVLPWVLILIAAVYVAVRGYRNADWQDRWLLEAILLVFVFFSLSGSRRWYYILPIMPFCSLLMAGYLQALPADRLRNGVLLATQVLLALVCVLLVASPLILLTQNIPVTPVLWAMSGGLLLLLPMIWLLREHIFALNGPVFVNGSLAASLATAALLMWSVFAVVLPYTDNFRHNKDFSLALGEQLLPGDRVAFYEFARPDILFYLDREGISPVVTRLSPQGLGDATVLLIRQGYHDRLARRLPELYQAGPLLSQPVYEWQDDDDVMSAWRVPGASVSGNEASADRE